MGNTIWLEVNDGATTVGDQADCSFPLLLQKELDGLAERLGLTKLSAFHDYSTVAQELGDELGELPEGVEMPAPAWFDAKEGWTAIAALLRALQEHPEELRFKASKSKAHWSASLVDDLQYLKAGLEQPAARGHKFRLLVVP